MSGARSIEKCMAQIQATDLVGSVHNVAFDVKPDKWPLYHHAVDPVQQGHGAIVSAAPQEQGAVLEIVFQCTRRECHRLFPDEAFADLFRDVGRRSVPPRIVAVAFGILGAIIGSFLNVAILRKGVAPLSGRSSCPACGRVLRWYDMVPVLSWMQLRGRCRDCGSSISIQYPLVEAATGILFALVGVTLFPVFLFSPVLALLLLDRLAIVSLLVAVTVYDFRHTIIPNGWVYSFVALALLSTVVLPTHASRDSIYTLLSGPAAALPLFLLWAISGGKWMGLGDSKLALGIGWLLGFPEGSVAVFFSFILGSFILVPILLAERIITHMRLYRADTRGLTMKSEVPFGPFLVASCLIIWFFQLYGVRLPLGSLGL